MLTQVHPRLPMHNKNVTRDYYQQLGFKDVGAHDYPEYLMMKKDEVELHFFLYKELEGLSNYSGVYIRVRDIENWYQWLQENKIEIHPNGHLEAKPWGQKEFALLDPDHNLLTFGEAI